MGHNQEETRKLAAIHACAVPSGVLRASPRVLSRRRLPTFPSLGVVGTLAPHRGQPKAGLAYPAHARPHTCARAGARIYAHGNVTHGNARTRTRTPVPSANPSGLALRTLP